MPTTILASLAAPHLPAAVALAMLRRLRLQDLERHAAALAHHTAGCAALKANHGRAG